MTKHRPNKDSNMEICFNDVLFITSYMKEEQDMFIQLLFLINWSSDFIFGNTFLLNKRLKFILITK